MKELYLDIENTIIDSLDTANFLHENCEKIRNYIRLSDGLDKIHLFTWGWKTKSEIELGVVDAIYKALQIDDELRGNVIVKENSVNEAIYHGWLDLRDKSRALQPGMMSEFGISKISCFYGMLSKKQGTHILIDDLVDEDDKETIGNVTLVLINPWRM